jgi:hypothetical protein
MTFEIAGEVSRKWIFRGLSNSEFQSNMKASVSMRLAPRAGLAPKMLFQPRAKRFRSQ